MPMLQAVTHAQATKGAKGDSRAARIFFHMVHQAGVLAGDESAVGLAKPIASNNCRPSEALFTGLDWNRFSRDELIDLSHLAEKIDLGGDFTALSESDFARLKFIINKGRGKDVTPLQ